MSPLGDIGLSDALVLGLSRALGEGFGEELSGLAIFPGEGIPTGPSVLNGRLTDRWNTPALLLEGIRSSNPAALHAGMTVLRKLDDQGAQAAARACLTRPRFPVIDELAIEILKPHAGDPATLDLFLERMKRSSVVADARWCTFLSDEAFDALDAPARREHEANLQAADDAVDTAEEQAAVRPLAGLLGTNRDQRSLETLLRLHVAHPRVNLRMAVGHALLALGTPAALSPLTSRLRIRDRAASFFATKAAFALSPTTAFDLLQLDQPLSRRAAIDLFRFVKPPFTYAEADPRWVDFFASWRNDDVVGGSAADLLKKVPKKLRDAAIARAKERAEAALPPKKVIVVPPKKELASWLARYEAGEHEEVWRLLGGLEAEVASKAVLPHAEAIAEATMLRLRRRIEEIVQVLEASGYQFSEKTPPWTPPAKDVDKKLKKLEKQVGPLPLALSAFYRHVGAVVLIGGHPAWPTTTVEQLEPKEKLACYSDPLVVWPLDAVLDDASDFESSGRFPVPVWPDPLGKAGYSAGGCVVPVQEPCADPLVEGDPLGRTFLGYLRASIAHAGFPGFGDQPPELLRPLCRPTDF